MMYAVILIVVGVLMGLLFRALLGPRRWASRDEYFDAHVPCRHQYIAGMEQVDYELLRQPDRWTDVALAQQRTMRRELRTIKRAAIEAHLERGDGDAREA